MGTTARGYPYPESGDPLAQGASVIKALATAVDTQLRATASGTVTIALANALVASVDVTYPAGRFPTAPTVVAACEDSLYYMAVTNRTPTAMRLWAHHMSNTLATGSKVCCWMAST